MSVTNKGIENSLRVIGQVATVPTDFNQLYMALGTGTTTINYSDTTLENEDVRVPIEPTFARRTGTGQIELQYIIDDTNALVRNYTNIGLFDASSSGNLIFAHKFASTVAKTAGVTLRFTIKYTLSSSSISDTAINLLAELTCGQSSDYLDNSNAAIEIISAGGITFRDTMETGYPSFASGNTEQLTWLAIATTTQISGASLGNDTFTSMDLYNKTSGGTQIVDATVSSSKIYTDQNLGLQYRIKVVR
jgi:hypothetical protein